MVLIEPETRQESKGETRIKKRFEISREEAAETQMEAPEPKQVSFMEDFKETLNVFVKDMKNVFRTIFASMRGMNIHTVGMNPQQKSQYFLKKCWHHMSRNEVEQAREAYDNLMDAYENLPEGTGKTDLYYEVYEIYQRLSQLK